MVRIKKNIFAILGVFILFLSIIVCPSTQIAAAKSKTVGAGTSQAPKQPTAIYQVNTDKKIVALTFDISWGEKTPDPVLDVLKEKKLDKATFFLSGPWTLQHADIAKRIKEMGYEIGSHGHAHKNFSEFDDAWIDTQVRKAEEAILQVTGVKPTLIRTPNGDFNKRVLSKLNSMGYQVIQWRTDSLDWKNPGIDVIQKRVLTKVVPGDIILMHASDSCKQTVQALPAVIDGLRQKGYKFVTVSELLTEAHISTKLES